MVGTVCLGSGRKKWLVRASSVASNHPGKGTRRSIDVVDEAKHLGHNRHALATPGRSPRDASKDRSCRTLGDSCSESGSGSGAEHGSRSSSKESEYSGSAMLMQVGQRGSVSFDDPAEHHRTPSKTSQESDHGASRANNYKFRRSVVSPYSWENKDEGIVAL